MRKRGQRETTMRSLHKTIFFLITLFLCCIVSDLYAKGGEKLWELQEVRIGQQVPTAATVDSAGNVIITGVTDEDGTDDYFTAKFSNISSKVLWRKLYKLANDEDHATAVVTDSANNVIVTGYCWSSSAHYAIHTIKYDPAGNVLWEDTFPGNGGDAHGMAVTVDTDGNVYVAGYEEYTANNYDFLILKYAAGGGAPTPIRYPHAGQDQITAIASGSGGIAVTGYMSNGANGYDIMTVKYDFNGNKLWEKPYGTTGEDMGKHIKIDASGNVIVTGYTTSATTMRDIYTAKYAAANGDVIWDIAYNNTESNKDDEPMSLWIDGDGNVLITGYTYTMSGAEDFYTVKYRGATKEVIWEKIYNSYNGNTDQTVPTGLVTNQAGDVFVTGHSYKMAQNNEDFQTIKYKKDTGNEVWQQGYNNPANRNDIPVSIGLAPDGNVYVMGSTDVGTITTPDFDYYVIKYDFGALDKPTGLTATTKSSTEIELKWADNSATIPPGNHTEDKFFIEWKIGDFAENEETPAERIIEVPAGTTTYTHSPLTPYTKYYYRIRAFNSTDGYSDFSATAHALTVIINFQEPAWVYTFSGGDGINQANAVAVGKDNNPVVTGSNTSLAYHTIKVNRESGERMWYRNYDSGEDDSGQGKAVTVDTSGDVIVTGFSTITTDGIRSNDVYTTKYPENAASGTDGDDSVPLWGINYPTSYDDRAVAIATTSDANKSIVVVGYGYNASGNTDIYVIKYTASGTLAWPVIVYNGGNHDQPTGVAMDANGNIFVTGWSFNGLNYDMFTAKYDGTTGVELWKDVYDSGRDERAHAIAVDTAGNAYVTGYATNASGNTDFYTIKYHGTTKAKLWTDGGASYNGPANGNDEAKSVKIDPVSGDVIVAGTIYSGVGNNDFHVIRYYAVGGVAWQRTVDRELNDDCVVTMDIDRSGNICVAGNTICSSFATDMMSVMLDYEGNISSLTTKGTTGEADACTSVAINNLGEAFIAGYATNALGGTDFIVYKCGPVSLEVPTPVTLTPSYRTIAIGWVDNSLDEAGYKIYRKLGTCSVSNTNPFELKQTTLQNANSWIDTDATLATGTEYCYGIQAFKDNGETSRWYELPVTTLIPQAPDDLMSNATNTTQIDLTWTSKTFPVEDGFRIERCDQGANCDTTFTADKTFTTVRGATKNYTYSDSTVCVANVITYRYRVVAYKNSPNDWESPASTVISKDPSAVPSAPVLSANRISDIQINLSWTYGSTDKTGFTLQRCPKDTASCQESDYIDIPLPDINQTSLNDITVQSNATYTYRVRAYKTTADCSWNTAYGTASAMTSITNPTLNNPASSSTTQVDLGWIDNSYCETGFDVLRCLGSSCTPVAMEPPVTLFMNMNKYSDTTVCQGQSYKYIISAFKNGLSNSGGGNWTKRIPVPITNFQADLPTKISVALDADMQPDFDDIRFYDETSARELLYWIEPNPGSTATVWVKTGGNNTINMYYGNGSAISSSDGDSVFEFFDAFRGTVIDTNKWAEIDPNNSIVQNDDLILNDVSDAWDKALISKKTFTRTADKMIYMKLKIAADTAGNNHFMLGWELDQTSNPSYNQLVHGLYFNNYLLTTYEKGNSTGPNNQAYVQNTEYEVRIILKSANASYYIKGGVYTNWTQIVPTTIYNYNDATMRIAFTQYSHQANIHFVTVQKYMATEPSVPAFNYSVDEQTETSGYTFTNTWTSPSIEKTVNVTAAVKPTLIAANVKRISEFQVDLSWTNNTTDHDGIRIERCIGAVCENLPDLPKTQQSYSDKGLTPNTTYTYRVAAFKNASCPWVIWSDGPFSATTDIQKPGTLTATAANTTQVSLVWSGTNAAETGCDIEKCLDGSCSTITVGPDATTYTDNDVCSSKDSTKVYSYKVRAFKNGLSFANGGTWNSRVKLNITDFQPNYPTKLTITFSNFSGMQADFKDIRFYDPTQEQELPYWIENKVDGSTATVWIKTGDNNDIYMYYDNPNATSVSNNNAVLVKVDDYFKTNIKAAWKFDEGSGTTANDSSGNGNHGTLTNSPAWIAGKFGNALNFNGSNSYVRRTSGTNLPLGSSARTYMAWIKPTSYPDASYNGILAYGLYGTSQGSLLSIKNDGRLSMAFWSNDASQTTGTAIAVPAATWNHVAFTYSGSGTKVKFYINGQFMQESNLSPGYAVNTQNGVIRIGSTDDYGRVFNGAIDEVYILDKALSDSEMLGIYNGAATGSSVYMPSGAGQPAVSFGTADNSGPFTFPNTWVTDYNDVKTVTMPVPASPVLNNPSPVSATKMSLSWTYNGADHTGLKLYRCTAPCTISTDDTDKIKDLGPTETSYIDPDRTPSTTYNYQVRAYKTTTCGWETSSTTKSGTTTSVTPDTLATTNISTTQVKLTWADRSDDETGFVIQRCYGSSCDFSAGVETYYTKANVNTLIDKKACKNSIYKYRVKAVKTGLSFGNYSSASFGNYSSGWTIRRKLNITNFQPNFQTKLIIAFNDFSGMQADFRDIRFYDATAAVELPYWIESKADGSSATVWFKTGANNNIYIYYGNAHAGDASSGESTYEIYDDFSNDFVDTARWTTGYVSYAAGTDYYQAGGFLIGGNNNRYIRSVNSFTGSFIAETRLLEISSAGNGFTSLSFYGNSSNGIGILVHNGTTYARNDGSWPYSNAFAAGEWTLDKIIAIGANSTTTRTAEDGNPTFNYTCNNSGISNEYLRLGTRNDDSAYGQNYTAYWDWVRVRKYAATEPVVSFVDPAEAVDFAAAFPGRWASSFSTSYTMPSATSNSVTPGISVSKASEAQINVSWSYGSTDRTGFKLQRCPKAQASCVDGDYIDIPLMYPHQTSYGDTGVEANKTYTYRVWAYKESYCSWESTKVYGSTNTNVTAPVLSAPTAPNTTEIDLVWTDTGSSETGFKVERCEGRLTDCTSDSNFSQVGPNLTAITYNDTSVKRTTWYTYRIRMFKDAGATPYWDVLSSKQEKQTPGIAVPTDLKATTYSEARIDLAWKDTNSDETGFKIYRCTGPACNGFEYHDTVNGATAYSDTTNVEHSTTYRYYVTAYKTATEAWETGASNIVTADASVMPPTNLLVSIVNSRKVSLTWDDNSDDEDGFEIEMQIWNGRWVVVGTVKADIRNYNDSVPDVVTSTTDPAKVYRYRVRAYKGGTRTQPTNEVPVTMPKWTAVDETCTP